MNKYTIYCTPEQTQKALALGAPIEYETYCINGISRKVTDGSGEYIIIIPTAEQMIGWLEERECISEVDIFKDFTWTFSIWDNALLKIDNTNVYLSRKEATFAAIDAALEYLIKK